MATMDEGAAGRQANFLQKLFDFLALDPHPCPEVIYWAVDSKQLVIAQPERLAREVLPKLYKHDKIASFGRQLNIYGFSRVFPGRQFKDASGTVLDASVWSHPTLHRLSTTPEVLAVKRRAAPKLFRNRRLANGQTVRTKAGPEVERKFRAIKEDMAMERRMKHFSSSGIGGGGGGGTAGASQAVSASQGQSQGMGYGNVNGHGHGGDRRYGEMGHTGANGGNGRGHNGWSASDTGRRDSVGMTDHGYMSNGYGDGYHTGYRRDSEESMVSDMTLGRREYDEATQNQWTSGPSISPVYNEAAFLTGQTAGNGYNGYTGRPSLEPIAEYSTPAPAAFGNTPFTQTPYNPTPVSPLSPIPQLSPSRPEHVLADDTLGRVAAPAAAPPFPASMWQNTHPVVPSQLDHSSHTANGGDARVYRSCPASIHSSPTFRPTALRAIMEHTPGNQTVSTQRDPGTVQVYPNNDQMGVRVAAPATANPFAGPPPFGSGIEHDRIFSNGGNASGTPSPVGLTPLVHDNYDQTNTTGHSMMPPRPSSVMSTAVSPLSRAPAVSLQPALYVRQPTHMQGLSIEIPPQTATFDASMHGIGQYVSPISGPPTGGSMVQLAQPDTGHMTSGDEGGMLYRSGRGSFESPRDGMDVEMGIGQATGNDGGKGQYGTHSHGQQPTSTESHERTWEMTGSIDPKWVSPQGSTWNTPIPTPRDGSPVGPLPAFFPSL